MDLRIRAGKKAFEIIKDGGFHFDRITTYVGPAVGPRWLVASGFDLAMLEMGLLGRAKPVLLAGASAGAWRFAAWLQPEPEKSYRKLIESYISLTYGREDNPGTILKAIRSAIDDYIDSDALPFALANKKYRLSITTARARHLNAADLPWLQKMGLVTAFLANALNPSLLHRFFERVVFYYAPLPPRFCLRADFRGKTIPLNAANFKDAVIASGAIPLVVGGVRDIYGGPNGIYRDGGLFDYHLNHDYTYKEGELTLLFHHQKKIIPGWLDKKIKSRKAPESILDNVLMIYPDREFVKKLPLGKVPDRDDFVTFLDRPEERINAWRQTVAACASFGEQFVELADSHRLQEIVRKL